MGLQITKVKAVAEDIEFGLGTVEQVRNGVSGTYSQINASHIPYSPTQSISEKVESLESGTNLALKYAWEAEARKRTAASYAKEAENVEVKEYTSNNDGSFSVTSLTGTYSALHYEAKADGNLDAQNWKADASKMTAESYAVESTDVIVYTSNGDGTFTQTVQTGVDSAKTARDKASVSAAAAATSESNAATSESNASTSESNALASKNAAATSETNAATSESNAKTSETNAYTKATEAATSASNAATSESNAATSANNAATSESNSSTSESNSQLFQWESEAWKMTAQSFAEEPEDVYVKLYTSNGDGTFSYTNHTDYSATHYKLKAKAYAASVNPDNLAHTDGTETSEISTTNNIESGRGSGGVAMTINDGYGNANLTFNHKAGIPEQDGNSARIVVNTDLTTGAYMDFQTKSGVTNGTATRLTSVMRVYEGRVDVLGSTVVRQSDYATSTVGGTLKARLNGSTLYLRNDGNNA